MSWEKFTDHRRGCQGAFVSFGASQWLMNAAALEMWRSIGGGEYAALEFNRDTKAFRLVASTQDDPCSRKVSVNRRHDNAILKFANALNHYGLESFSGKRATASISEGCLLIDLGGQAA